MIGVDTNVLVRYLTQDDPSKARRVDAFLSGAVDDAERVRIDDIVLCEMVWVLRGAFRLGKPAITDALEKVLSTALFSFEDRELLRTALDDYRDGRAITPTTSSAAAMRKPVCTYGDLRPAPSRSRLVRSSVATPDHRILVRYPVERSHAEGA